MEATLLLARVKGDRAPPASKKKSPLPHLRQEETSSFLQSDGTEESFISTKQAGPSNLTRKKRAPPTPQSAKNFLPHSLGKGKNRAPDCLLFLFRRWKRAYAPEESMEFPRPAKIKVWSSPSPAVKKSEDEYSSSCSHSSGLERLSALFHRRQCLAHPFIFSGDDALENFQSQGKSPSWFLELML